ncbi:hypothetical protein [Streptomyces sp. NPDC093094]|uniref:hypothetical protein n=1 Tax=Streptomyces sp. NPDC093094 TaxID=3366026 RepID=UPI0037F8567F
MADQAAVTADGYCTHTAPQPGSIRTLSTQGTGPKFFRLHGRRYGTCPCGREMSLTERGNLRRHKPPHA